MDWCRFLRPGGPPAAARRPRTLDRVALIGTPRSGNTWLRSLLATVYGLDQVAVHRPGDIDMSSLPDRCILQLHWRKGPDFLALLEEGGFRAVILARHPLDVLVSILQFAPHEPQTGRWLDGEGGDEAAILGKSPGSPEFLGYATGPRAAALLSVGREWWGAPGCVRFRYEALVDRPEAELGRGCGRLGGERHCSIAEAVGANTMERMRRSSRNRHFWQGKPGLWRDLIPAAIARQIASAHRPVFEGLGYRCDPDESLDERRAEVNWARLTGPPGAGAPWSS